MRRLHDDLDGQRPVRRHARAPADEAKARNDLTATSEPERNPAQVVETLQRTAGNAAVQQLLSSAEPPANAVSGGEPVAPTIRAAAERKLGTDLADVRVHGDAAAGAYAHSLGAEAVTVAHDVFFRDGAPDVATSRGQKLYVHELTHAAQAHEGGGSGVMGVSEQSSPAEREAKQVAIGGLGGASVTPTQAAPARVAHLQVVTADEEQIEEQAPGTTPATPAPAPDTQPDSDTSTAAQGGGTAPQAPSPLRALFRVAVDQRIIAAHAALTAAPPDPRLAGRELDSARDSVKALIGSFRDTDPLMTAGLAALANGITSVIMAIKPHIGEGADIAEIARLTNILLGTAASVGSQMK